MPCDVRANKPIYTKTKLALAVLFLYQVGNSFLSSKSSYFDRWFPMYYVYCEYESNGWEKLVSKMYCENICALFGVSSIDELKKR